MITHSHAGYLMYNHFKTSTTPHDKHTHCWHSTGVVLTSYPPQIPEVCCHCGEQRTRPQPRFEHNEGHGKYAPSTTFTLPEGDTYGSK
jgi:hypothetical protein